MPKLPRVSSHKTVQILEKLGFVQIRQRGSHLILKKTTYLRRWTDYSNGLCRSNAKKNACSRNIKKYFKSIRNFRGRVFAKLVINQDTYRERSAFGIG